MALEIEPMLALERSMLVASGHLRSEEPVIGLALSGGGVRSGAVALGFLERISEKNLLSCFDYCSSVSGGGYASGYLMAAAHAHSGDASHDKVFDRYAKEELKTTGQYLATGTGLRRRFRRLRLIAAFVHTLVLNLLWVPGAVVVCAAIAAITTTQLPPPYKHSFVLTVAILLGLLTALLRVVLLPIVELLGKGARTAATKLQWRSLSRAGRLIPPITQRAVNVVEAIAIYVGIRFLFFMFFAYLGKTGAGWLGALGLPVYATSNTVWLVVALVAAALVLIILATSDAWSLYVFFRNLIETSFCAAPYRARAAGRKERSLLQRLADRWNTQTRDQILLRDAWKASKPDKTRLPYPLFNAATYFTNKKSSGKEALNPLLFTRPGASADYPASFLLSPFFCGTEKTGFVQLQGPEGVDAVKATRHDAVYDELTLADAITCSAASLTPLLHGNSSIWVRLAFLLGNLNLAAWLANPNSEHRKSRSRFWPGRYQAMLAGGSSPSSSSLVVADGAFADNLGVIELLRRECSLIVCVDSTYDPRYEFHELRRLTVRAREELKVELRVPRDAQHQIKPSYMTGFCRDPALVIPIRGTAEGNEWTGVMVYIKSALVERLPLADQHGAYDEYHPKFPQETTGDQFFDEPQWMAYNTLGVELADRLIRLVRADLDSSGSPGCCEALKSFMAPYLACTKTMSS